MEVVWSLWVSTSKIAQMGFNAVFGDHVWLPNAMIMYFSLYDYFYVKIKWLFPNYSTWTVNHICV